MDVSDLKPEVLRRIVFAVAYLPFDCPKYWEVIRNFALAGSTSFETLAVKDVKLMVENLQALNESVFTSDESLSHELRSIDHGPCKPLGVVLVSSNNTCKICGGKLLLRGDRFSRITIYTEANGTLVGSHFVKFCQRYRTGCQYNQHYGYHTIGDSSISHYDNNWIRLKYFVSTSQTAFELRLLQKFDVEILIGQLSYKQKSDIYNCVNEYDDTRKQCASLKQSNQHKQHKDLLGRLKLDRRRLEDGHLRYAILKICNEYGDLTESDLSISSDVSVSLQIVASRYYDKFTMKYAAHSCKIPGCQKVIVLDGNMKNRRHVCNARDAGYIQYSGLPGKVKTGCMMTPQYKSRFCSSHQLLSCVTDKYEEIADDEVEKYAKDEDSKLPMHKSEVRGEPIVEVLLQKKQLRSRTFYKVLWLGQAESKCSWVPVDALPSEAVAAFENGTCSTSETIEECEDNYGSTRSTFVMETKLRAPKKPRLSRPTIESTSGVFENDVKDCSSVVCNTIKDKHILKNHRTAGILAGMWPCGIITFLSELFVSESKTQVYGTLCSFYRKVPEVASNIKCVIYDDGCHLSKFARHPSRSGISSESSLLAKQDILIDRMHMKGHTDKWCKENCDPEKHSYLDNVNTEVCEQAFSWLSKYSRITQSMSQHTFIFYLLYLCDLHNTREVNKLQETFRSQ